MKNKIATIIGGSGFIGSHITKLFLEKGYMVQVISRDPHKSDFMKTFGQVGRLHLKPFHIKNLNSAEEAIKGSTIVVNLAGILSESKKQSFYKTHTHLPYVLAKACNSLNIQDLIHFSALGVDKAACSNYATTKLSGEKDALKEKPDSIIIRPSVVFGKGDSFINMFIKHIKLSPILPLINEGSTKFQPVHVKDLILALSKIIDDTKKFHGKILELGGAKVIRLKEIFELIRENSHSNCCFFGLPHQASMALAYAAELFPKPFLTRDQVRLLKYNNIVHKDSNTIQFKDLGIKPKSLDQMLNIYVE